MAAATPPLLSVAAAAQAARGVLMPGFCSSFLPFLDDILSLTHAHTQHRHGPVAQAFFFLMVMGFPHHLQVVILEASTICSVYHGLFAPSMQILDCIWIEWMDRLQGLQCTTLI
ncbi:hypothetical protein VPH35_001569 [Triticum aestivum]